MNKIIFQAVLLACSGGALFAQDTKRDTMQIILNGEQITVPVPKHGNKTTISLEDSLDIIQVSVSKSTKNMLTGRNRDKGLTTRYTRWISEVEFGLSTLAGPHFQEANDTSVGYYYYNSASAVSVPRGFIAKVTPSRENAGFTFGFSIREKSRPLGVLGLNFITGSRFRFSRFSSRGHYDYKQIKVSEQGGTVVYYPDSVYYKWSGDYRTSTINYQILFPFMLEKQWMEGDLRVSAGVNLALNISNIRLYATPLNNNMITTDFSPKVIAEAKASYKKISLYMAYNMGDYRYVYGRTSVTSGHILNMGVAVRLY